MAMSKEMAVAVLGRLKYDPLHCGDAKLLALKVKAPDSLGAVVSIAEALEAIGLDIGDNGKLVTVDVPNKAERLPVAGFTVGCRLSEHQDAEYSFSRKGIQKLIESGVNDKDGILAIAAKDLNIEPPTSHAVRVR